MNKLYLIFLFIFCFKLSYAQNIVGRWQANLAAVGDEHLENYQFFADGTFCFNTDDGALSKVIKFGGTYRIVRDKIVMLPKYYIELTGGYITRTGAEPGTALWSFVDSQENRVEIKKVVPQSLPFKLYKKQGNSILEVDLNKYYKINDDPNKYGPYSH